jgi:choloylglycine hydrolase
MLKESILAVLTVVIFSTLLAVNVSFACTDFQIKAEDGSIVIARSNEFGVPPNSSVVFEPSGKEFSGMTPEGQKGLSWKSRYGFLGINGMGMSEKFADGMNEAGLSIEGLLFSESKYEPIGPGNSAQALSNIDFGKWVLSNFATVDELKKALSKVSVWGEVVPQLGGVLPLHFAVHDAAGSNLVIEFINGEKKIYDNPIGVMTNMPEFPWQITNLRNYVKLDSLNAKPKTFSGVVLKQMGQGSGWLGLPGDWTPPARFVRAVQMVNAAFPAKDAKEALILAGHIINTVDIPHGVIRDEQKDEKSPVVSEYTPWTVYKDLTNRILYFRTYENPNLRFIDLKKLVSDPSGKSRTIPMSTGAGPEDLTADMSQISP